MTAVTIKKIEALSPYRADLETLLTDSIDSGASIGFVAPLQEHEVPEYWNEVERKLSEHFVCFVALKDNKAVGCVKLETPTKTNGNHRAEIQKLMVHRNHQGQGIAKALMMNAEKFAKDNGLKLLVLDTRLGDVASTLYRRLDYIEAGQIPMFARSSNGDLEATVYFYKAL
ncbi:GNAT family N-acetyltransferase [Thalassotalea euphylliae]|uniref:GNAT family N-acetyltransferase n=1 Tax=Thalassotalea euphylliae TaxID=1655234 RepID=UPI0036D78C6C